MKSRKEVTRRLSELVEKRITGRNMVWSREVPFDKGYVLRKARGLCGK